MTTYDVDGHQVQFLSSVETVGWVIDNWLDEAEDTDSPARTGVVMTIRPHAAYATVEPFIPWGQVFGIAWEVEPASEPLGRFQEALRQGSLRAEERMAGVEGLAPGPRR